MEASLPSLYQIGHPSLLSSGQKNKRAGLHYQTASTSTLPKDICQQVSNLCSPTVSLSLIFSRAMLTSNSVSLLAAPIHQYLPTIPTFSVLSPVKTFTISQPMFRSKYPSGGTDYRLSKLEIYSKIKSRLRTSTTSTASQLM
jgi:hypothetical protein